MRDMWIGVVLLAAVTASAQDSQPSREQPAKRGLLRQESGVTAGYVLYAPLRSTKTYLIDRAGQVVHTWNDEASPGHAVHLLPNGDLLRAVRDRDQRVFEGGGIGGLIRRFDWSGKLVWEFDYSDESHCQHHDIKPLPSGNVLVLAWGRKSRDEALAAGRKAELVGENGIWPCHIVEVEPTMPTGGKVVWEWHAWDHLIQDADKTKANYGDVRAKPERIDVNYGSRGFAPPRGEMSRLRNLGYVGGGEEEDGPPAGERRGERPGPREGRGGDRRADWLHCNSIDYNTALDQIVISAHNFNEVWIIDHSTTAEEARGSTGGKSGRGGDLLYRWGNPAAHRAGGIEQQRLFGQHDATWIGDLAKPHLLVFNNGAGRRGASYSSVEQIELPIAGRTYAVDPGEPFAPAEPKWMYTGEPRGEFYSGHISGAQRLPSGNTLICSGESGRIFEVTPSGAVVWDYLNPHGGDAPMDGPRGPRPPGGGGDGARPGGPPRDAGDGPRREGGDGPPRDGGDGPPRGPMEGRGGPRNERYALFRATWVAQDHPAIVKFLSGNADADAKQR